MNATLRENVNMPSTFGEQRSGWNTWRIVAVLCGSLLVLCSLGLIVGGGYLLSEATSDGGWLELGHGAYHTDTYAVVTEPNDWSNQTYALDNVDKVRIRVTPSDGTTPVFVGMARASDVERYLGDVRHVTVHGASNYRVTYTQHDGHAPTSPPAKSIPWTIQSTGTGTQTLEFDAREQPGDQVLVVMNANGSAALDGKADSTATQSSLSWIAGGLLAGGIFVAAAGILLIVKPGNRVKGRN